jgi:RNA polymerase subunit RPABC4/transcription elongation factor Spt4
MDIFGGLMKGLKPLMNATGMQADDEMKSVMLQGEVSELEGQKRDVFAGIGEAAYKMAKEDNWDRGVILASATQVEAIDAQLKVKKEELDKAKQADEEKKRLEAEKLAVRTCPDCGELNSEGTKFCQNCGAKLGMQKPSQNICSKCGAVNDPESKFCGECGANIAVVQNAEIKCRGCGTVQPAGTKFCNQCGSRL